MSHSSGNLPEILHSFRPLYDFSYILLHIEEYSLGDTPEIRDLLAEEQTEKWLPV